MELAQAHFWIACASSLIFYGLEIKRSNVLHILNMSCCNPVNSLIPRSSYGTHLLDYLAADGAGFPGSQVTVVAVGQVDTHFLGSLHLETVHSLASLGNIQLVVVRVAHFDFSASFNSGKQDAFRMENIFFFPYSQFAQSRIVYVWRVAVRLEISVCNGNYCGCFKN